MSYNTLRDAAARAEECEFDVDLTLSVRGVEIEMWGNDGKQLCRVVPWLELELSRINPVMEMLNYMEQEIK